MSESQLFIPDKIKVGFQKREGTYTGKLAYIIYFDKKGVLRKETSWESWRDDKIEPTEHGNEPTEGFVLNKGVGGARQSYGWNTRNEYIRVYDPRDFEFEISVANLLFILREGDCSRGKGLEGKFVYAWDRDKLVLLPAHSQDFQNSRGFTELQGKTIKVKDLILGASYITRKQKNLIYLGRFDYFFEASSDEDGRAKKYVFWDGTEFICTNDIKSIAIMHSDTVAPDYADLVDRYNRSAHGSRIAKLYLKEVAEDKLDYYNYWYYEESDGVFVGCRTEQQYQYIQAAHKYSLNDGVLIKQSYHAIGRRDGTSDHGYHWRNEQRMPYQEPTNLRLFAIMEKGEEFQVTYKIFQG